MNDRGVMPEFVVGNQVCESIANGVCDQVRHYFLECPGPYLKDTIEEVTWPAESTAPWSVWDLSECCPNALRIYEVSCGYFDILRNGGWIA